MYGYDLSSRSLMLNCGRWRLMKDCSASSASASFSVTRKSIEAIRSIISSREWVCEKWPATRLRIEVAFPT